MQYNKSPDVRILRPLSFTPKIKNKLYRITLFLKITFVALFIVALGAGVFYLNVINEQSILLKNKVTSETNKAVALESGIVIDATAAIIKREGNLPIEVAKKYALWIYDAGVRHNVDPILIMSVMAVESKFDYRAISPTGPIGLLQIAYTWHKEKTTQSGLFDPKNNINVGTQILKEYSDKSSTEVEMLLRFNGSLGSAPVYAMKVLSHKKKYSKEIMDAIVSESI